MKQITKIDVIFENCEFFSLDTNDLKFVNNRIKNTMKCEFHWPDYDQRMEIM